jgi:hypothetical protein
MLTTGERATAHRMAVAISERGDLDNDNLRRLLATALVESEARERGYQVRVSELQDTIERITASGVENATRYAVGIATERRAGAAAIERIRAALLEGATDAMQQWATIEACDHVGDTPNNGTLYKMSRAYLAMSEELKATREALRKVRDVSDAVISRMSPWPK